MLYPTYDIDQSAETHIIGGYTHTAVKFTELQAKGTYLIANSYYQGYIIILYPTNDIDQSAASEHTPLHTPIVRVWD